MTSLPPLSTLDPGSSHGTPPPKINFDGNPPFTQTYYHPTRVLGDRDMNWMRPLSPHGPGEHFSTGRAQMHTNENLSADQHIEEATDVSLSLPKKKGESRKMHEEFTVVELEKLITAGIEVDPFICKYREVDVKWKEVLELVQEKGYCKDRTFGSVKNKILGEIKRVEQAINPNSQLGKEMHKRAVDTKEEEHDGKRQKDNANKLIGAQMRESMMKGRINLNKSKPNNTTDSGSDQPDNEQSNRELSSGKQSGGKQSSGEQSSGKQSSDKQLGREL
ncbi:hypothetical protein M422DRAFT_269045 [Sphaerobolus stellatus SS14]|uniref:Uncharacterized protein n=1 Tax=Sphaerobolus stellatus (strain SS14) TaxID=990650 RepID=A0A0C9UW11_SPHS4|nr:hypothetical protein M422DRAFT_269045 [Sphaerobolus stellatus SS14]